MNKEQLTEFSKFCSYCLRHAAQEQKLTIDNEGWVNIGELLERANEQGYQATLSHLHTMVQTNAKKRFQISIDGQSIRAVQGHTNKSVQRNFESRTPPDVLYHGTATRFLESILASGLSKMSRHHVHLSTNVLTATEVGQRYGQVVILEINTKKMHENGFIFYLSENNVWLVDSVPTEYITVSLDPKNKKNLKN